MLEGHPLAPKRFTSYLYVMARSVRKAILILVTPSMVGLAQPQPDLPSLTERFGRVPMKADFVIVLDRSRSMRPFWGMVVSSASDFIDALPDGDYVSLLYFDGHAGELLTPRELTPQSRPSLKQQLAELEDPTGGNTDLGVAIDRTLDELNRPGSNRLQFVFFFTDFVHQPPQGSRWRSRSPNDPSWFSLSSKKQRFIEEQRHLLKVYALRLPLGQNVGRDISLFETVFGNVELVTVSDAASLRAWFDRRRAEIHRDKLRLIVNEAIANELSTIVSVSFTAKKDLSLFIQWQKATLINQITIASISVRGEQGLNLIWRSALTPVEVAKGTPETHIAFGQTLAEPLIERSTPVTIEARVSGAFSMEPSEELNRLGIAPRQNFERTLTVSGRVRYGRFPIWMAVLGGAFVLAVVATTAWTCLRPLSITGTILVIQPHGLPLSMPVTKRRYVSVGEQRGSADSNHLLVPGVQWRVAFKTQRNCPLRLWRKAGVYALLDAGITATVTTPSASQPQQLAQGAQTLVERGARVEIEERRNVYIIMWQ